MLCRVVNIYPYRFRGVVLHYTQLSAVTEAGFSGVLWNDAGVCRARMERYTVTSGGKTALL